MTSATPKASVASPTTLTQAITSYIKQRGATVDDSHRFFAELIDLNGDSTQDAIVVFSSSYWCGTGGCTMLVFEGKKDQTFRLVSESSLVRPPITVAETSTNGWRDLILTVSGGGMPAKTVSLKFDGKQYPLNPSDQPALPQSSLPQGTALFPDGTEPQTLSGTASQASSQANLKLYNDPVMAISTQYPDTMTVEPNCSGEGCGYSFKLKPQNNALDQSEVQIFLPSGAKTAAEVETFVVGSNNLLDSNGWVAMKDAKPPQDLMYPWVKKVIPFSADKEMTGYILIGETNGQGVRATLLYSAEMSNAFMPNAKTILDNLQFKPDKLPIKSST
jgi:hypothetical protein